VFVLLVTAQNLNEELVPFLINTVNKTGWILKQLGEDSVGIAESSAVDVAVLEVPLHQQVEPLEQVQFKQVWDVLFVPRQVQVEARDQSDDQGLLIQLVLSLLNFLLMVLKQVVDSIEDTLAIEAF